MEKEIKVGDRFGKLVVLGFANHSKLGAYYFVKCECGTQGKMFTKESLLNGVATSCGCEKAQNHKKYKRSTVKNPFIAHPLHKVWDTMKSRCKNPKRAGYYLYGGRGIKVCEEWSNRITGYMNFYKWAINNGYKYEPTLKGKRNRYTLDRIDPNGNYCPENCRWIDVKEQGFNKRADCEIEFMGEKKKIKEFLKDFNATVPYFYYLLKDGMNESEALEFLSKQ